MENAKWKVRSFELVQRKMRRKNAELDMQPNSVTSSPGANCVVRNGTTPSDVQ